MLNTVRAAITMLPTVRPPPWLNIACEIVLIIEGAAEEAAAAESLEDAVEMARLRMEGGMSPSLAAKEAAEITGFKKGQIYKQLIAKSENTDH